MSSMQSQVSRKFNDDLNVPNDAKKIVETLISEGSTAVTSSLINNLRAKYNDSKLVDLVIEILSEKVSKIQSRAQKFASAILKHAGQDVPLHTLLKKAYSNKDKLGLSDAEFEFFKMNLLDRLNNGAKSTMYSQGFQPGNTNLSRALGTFSHQNVEGLTVEQQDFPYLQEIIKQHAVSKPVHSSVVMQHLLYREFAGEAMLGSYDQSKHNAACHVHPVIAAMFLPKIKIFEETFLLANIAHIVRCRYEKKDILTYPDYTLMYSLITDPNDVVCDLDSPFKDLRNRALLQETLWQSVLAIRNGRYYDCISAQFLSAIDNCKLSNADAPDVIYIGDEGTVMRRLLQAFSFRPIIVSTMPLYGVVAPNTANFPVMMNRVTAIPMITIRLPLLTSHDQEPISLEQSLSLPQYYVENDRVVPKVQSIIYTRGVIIFHVARRTQKPNYQTMVEPYKWNSILPTISSYERINTREVIAEDSIAIQNVGEHHLKSVVTLNINPVVPDLIVGTAAVFRSRQRMEGDILGAEEYYMYNPQMAAIKRAPGNDFDNTQVQSPVVKLYRHHNEVQSSYSTLVSRYGTIYIYSHDDSQTPIRSMHQNSQFVENQM